jgi:gliding motility-associated-like protein
MEDFPANTCTAFETGVYTVKVLNTHGCYAQNAGAPATVTVFDMPLVPVIIANASSFYLGLDYVLEIQTPENNVRYDWYKNSIPVAASLRIPLPYLSASDAGTYTVEAVTEHTCRLWSAPFSITAEISPLFIPNVFTPNGDGVNDNFRIAGLEDYDGNELVIINKRGKTVFSQVNYNNEWYGDDQPDDIYYYHLTLTIAGVTSRHQGYLHIKRR